jgi:site-specific DNA recombinase
MKSVLYISDIKDVDIETQKEILAAYCRAKGWTIYQIYVDETNNINKPALKMLLEDMCNWDVLVVLKIAVIYQGLDRFLDLFKKLMKEGKHFVAVQEELDTTLSQDIGKQVLLLLEGLAQLKRETISEQTKLGMEQAKKQGYHVGRPPKLFEKEYVDGHLRIKPTDKAKQIFEMHRQGLSIRVIATLVQESPATVWRTIQIMEKLRGETNEK